MPQIREPVTGGKDWSERYTYVPALRVGNMVWLSGRPAPTKRENHRARRHRGANPADFSKIREAAEFDRRVVRRIVETHDFFTTTENYKGTAAVRREFSRRQSDLYRRACRRVLRKDALIEIRQWPSSERVDP